MCMWYLVLIEEVLLKTVMFDVEQFEWRGIDQATRWHFELTKSKPGYDVHHNTRSLDIHIHTQNTYSSAPSRGSSCEPNYYQNRYKQHPKCGSCGLTLQQTFPNWKQKFGHQSKQRYSPKLAANTCNHYPRTFATPAEVSLLKTHRTALLVSSTSENQVDTLGPVKDTKCGFLSLSQSVAANVQCKNAICRFLPILVLAIGRPSSNFRFFLMLLRLPPVCPRLWRESRQIPEQGNNLCQR